MAALRFSGFRWGFNMKTEEEQTQNSQDPISVFFSSAIGGFLLGADREVLTQLGSWPADSFKLTEEEKANYWKQSAPMNMLLQATDGRLAWVPIPAPTPEALIATALAERDALLRTATLRIAPLQDAVDIDEATAEETALLKKWKKYRVDLSRIEQQAAYPTDINWPEMPA